MTVGLTRIWVMKAFPADFSLGDVPVVTWSFRGCVIEGSQRLYLVLLWYWGSRVRKASSSDPTPIIHDPALAKITMPLALLMWIVGIVIYTGLPDCFHQAPGQIPSFYRTISRRKIILVGMILSMAEASSGGMSLT